MGVGAGLAAGIGAIAMDVGVGSALAGTIGTIGSGVLIGAGLGAATSAITGGDPGQGALFGALSGGALGAFGGAGGAVAQGLGVSGTTADALIGGGMGAAESGLTGGNPLTGGLTGALSGAAAGMMGVGNPSDTGAGAPMGSGTLAGTADAGGGNVATSPLAASSAAAAGAGAGGGGGGAGSGLSNLFGGKIMGIPTSALAMGALSAGSSLLSKPAVSNQALAGPSSVAANLGPSFNMPLSTGPVPGRTAVNPMAGQPMSAWYKYGNAPEASFFTGNQLSNFHYARGGPSHARGALQMVEPHFAGAGHVNGPGDGQDDDVNAKLSDGEFVFDATTVSRLGNGSNRRGAQTLEEMRRQIAHDAGSSRVVQKRIRKGALGYLDEARRASGGMPR